MSGPVIPENLPELGVQSILAWKAFGPPAAALGDQLADLVRFAGDNVRQVVRVSVEKLGDRIDEPGSVSARALIKTLEEAAISDDEIVAEYLGGVLASARSEDGRDDRSVSWSALIGRLSSDQLRLHYALYSGLHRLAAGQSLNLMQDSDRKKLMAYVGFGSLFEDCKWWDPDDPATTSTAFARFAEAFDGLYREGLIEGDFLFGNKEHIERFAPGAPDAGAAWTPSLPGIRLYLWGHGLGHELPHTFLEDRELVAADAELSPPEDISLTSTLQASEKERRRIAKAEDAVTQEPR